MKVPIIPETDEEYTHDVWEKLKHCCGRLKEGGCLASIHNESHLDPGFHLRPMVGDGYHFVPIDYCPWCGEKIEYED